MDFPGKAVNWAASTVLMEDLETFGEKLRRRLVKGVVALVALALLAVGVFVVANVRDAGARPRPAALQVDPSHPGLPMFHAMQGVLVENGEAPEPAGRRAWAALQTGAVPPAAQLRLLGLPLVCPVAHDCAEQLLRQADALEAQLEPHADFGARCVAMLEDLRYAEALPARLRVDAPLPGYAGAGQCGHWFRGKALVATLSGDREAALHRLWQSRAVGLAVLAGSRRAVSAAVGAVMLASHQQAVVAVAALRPEWVEELAPHAEPLPPAVVDLPRLLAAEAALERGSFEALLDECRQGRLSPSGLELPDPRLLPALRQACVRGWGLLPRDTLQQLDERWLGLVQLARQVPPPAPAASGPGPLVAAGPDALEALLVVRLAARAQAQQRPWALRNPAGRLLLALNPPQLEPYLLRLADAELNRAMLGVVLDVHRQAVPRAARTVWLAQQRLPERLKARIEWQDNGQTLVGRTWSSELESDAARHLPVRMPVPAGR